MPRSRILLAGLALVLAGCSSEGRPVMATTPLPTFDPTPGASQTLAGPYPVVAVLADRAVQLDRGRDGGLITVGLLGAVTAEEGRCFATEATTEVHRLLDGQRVRVVADPAPGRTDAAGRRLVYVWLDSGRMANDVLIENGFAREATGGRPYVYATNFARSEELARNGGRGLWSSGTCAGNLTKPAGS